MIQRNQSAFETKYRYLSMWYWEDIKILVLNICDFDNDSSSGIITIVANIDKRCSFVE